MLDENISQTIIKDLVACSAKKGHVSKDDIRKALGADKATDEAVDEILQALGELEIPVSESDKAKVPATFVEDPTEDDIDTDIEDDLDDVDLIDDALEDEEEDIIEETAIDDYPTKEPAKKKVAADEDVDDDEEDEDEEESDDSMKRAWSGMSTDDDSAGGNRFVDISSLNEHDSEPEHVRHNTILGTDKSESSGDDPIRLYLREIGKENLLTAEQEVELSKKMEDGAAIIKEVIQESGIMITRFHDIIRTLNTKMEEIGRAHA